MAQTTEEVLVKVGIDSASVKRGLDGITTQFHQFSDDMKSRAEGMKQAFKDAMGGKGVSNDIQGNLSKIKNSIGVAFAGAAILAAGKKIIDFGAKIKETAEAFGVSTNFLQDFNAAAKQTGAESEKAEMGINKLSVKLGEAREGSEEAQKSFIKWGISMDNADGSARATEDVIRDIADKMKSTASGTDRAAMAMDLFGKSGHELIPVLQKGSENLDKFKASLKLNEDDLKTLDDAKKRLESLGTTALVVGGKIANATVGFAARIVGSIAGGGASSGDLASMLTDAVSPMPRLPAASAPAAGPIDVKQSKEWIEAHKARLKQSEEARLHGANADTKEVILRGKVRDLDEQIAKIKGDSVEKEKLIGEREKMNGDYLAQKAENEKTWAEKKLEREKKAREEIEKQKKLAEEMHMLQEKIGNQKRKIGEAENAPFMPTIEELANSGHWQRSNWTHKMQFAQSGFARDAQEIQRLTTDAREATEWGNFDRRDWDKKRIKTLRTGLEDAGVIQKNTELEEMNFTLKELNERAAGKSGGLTVTMGD